MTTPPRNRSISWYRRTWVWVVAAGIFILAAAAYLSPYPVARILTVDGSRAWDYAEAPARREVVWQPPETIELPGVSQQKGSLIRPQLANRGLTLYFTLRDATGAADIYSAQWEGEAWSPPEPVAVLNSAADDIGPVLSHDETELFIYSDRDGGFGGFDLYQSTKTADGWSPPVNLGPAVNTVAHEYDPAISRESNQLFFASNRTEKMQARTERAADRPPEWTETLRARQGLLQFDLYLANRTDDQAWQPATPLAELNRPDSNEGAPYLAGDTFLYFASDRIERPGDERNYDIYRARQSEETFVAVENLGAGVNTPANETEPWISREGFTLWFSSDRTTESGDPNDDGVYQLYASTAIEVFHDADWRQSQLPFIPNLSTLLFWLLIALLTLAFLTALWWYLRQVSLRRAPVPAFFLIALLVHLFLGAGTFFVAMNEELMAPIRETLEEAVAFDFSEPIEAASEPASFEKVSDVPLETSVAVSAQKRIDSEVAELPDAADFKLPTATPELSRSLPPEAKIEVAIPETPQQLTEPLLARRSPSLPAPVAAEAVETTPLEARPETETQVEQTEVALSRTQPTERPTPLPQQTSPEAPTKPSTASRESITAPIVESAPAPPAMNNQPALAKRSTPLAPATAVPTVELAQTAASQPAQENTQPASMQVAMAKRTADPVARPNEVLPTLRSASSPTNAEPITAAAPQFDAAPPSATTPAVALNRARPTLEPAAETAAIENGPATEPAEMTAATSPIGETAVVLARRESSVAEAKPATSISTAALKQELQARGETVAVAKSNPTVDAPATALPSLAMTRKRFDLANQPIEIEVGEAPAETTPNDDASGERAISSPSAIQLARRTPVSPEMASREIPLSPAESPLSSPTATRLETGNETATPAMKPSDYSLTPKLTGKRSRPIDANETAVADVALTALAPASPTPPPEMKLASTKIETTRTSPTGAIESPTPTALDLANPLLPKRTNVPQQTNIDRQVAMAAAPESSLPTLNSMSVPSLHKLRRESPLSPYAEATIGLTSMFRMRRGDNKDDIIKAFGGDEKSMTAVRRGLNWLSRHQHEDGRFSLNEFHQCCKDHKKCNGRGNVNSDVAGTGLALLPFLGDGHTHTEGDFRILVADGINWLVAGQQENGELTTGREGNARMYSHGIATITLCEAYGMTKDPALREPAQKAIDFIIWAQNEKSGGWRYQPHQVADTSVVGWQVMALKSAQMAELDVPKSVLDRTRAYLKSADRGGKNAGQYGYQKRNGSTPAMTAEALLCLEYLGADKHEKGVQQSADYLLSRLPKKGKDTSYYWYYGTQAMFHLQGEHWKEWNGSLKEMLEETQIKSGGMAGTWDPKDRWEKSAGRIYSTSLRLLMLEVYHRHLPLYSVGQ